MWETFHIDQIIPWIDANLRTISAARRDARSPGCRRAASARSATPRAIPTCSRPSPRSPGGCEIDRDPEAIVDRHRDHPVHRVGAATAPIPTRCSGRARRQELNWQAHDPATLVTNLRGMQIELWTGDGNRGPLDPGPPDPAASAIEVITFGATRLFHGHLDDAGIPSGYHYYGAGTHIFGRTGRATSRSTSGR